jgi:hypothetical protein
MGNRGNVIFTDGKKEFSVCTYLHWNGGPESVYGFLEELNRRNHRADQNYEAARFIQLVGEFFDNNSISTTSLGAVNGPSSDSVDALSKLQTDDGDNGFYLVNRTAGAMSVRRFITQYGKDYKDRKIVEMTPEQVADERAEADKHSYRGSFREFFLGLTKGKKIKAA